MEKEIILSPEALYYLGRLLQAKYIDYVYVAAMGDINQNYALFEKETKASLVSAGILTEDFSGNLELDETARKLLEPIFFGETETSLSVCTNGEIQHVSLCMFHFHDGIITSVTHRDGQLVLAATDTLSIRKQVEKLLPLGYDMQDGTVAQLSEDSITRFISVKRMQVGVGTITKTFVEADNILYHQNGEQLESVSGPAFITYVYQVVKGV